MTESVWMQGRRSTVFHSKYVTQSPAMPAAGKEGCCGKGQSPSDQRLAPSPIIDSTRIHRLCSSQKPATTLHHRLQKPWLLQDQLKTVNLSEVSSARRNRRSCRSTSAYMNAQKTARRSKTHSFGSMRKGIYSRDTKKSTCSTWT